MGSRSAVIRSEVWADHVHQSTGVNWLGALGALVAASLVIATAVVASHR
jgi:hypothetical protein